MPPVRNFSTAASLPARFGPTIRLQALPPTPPGVVAANPLRCPQQPGYIIALLLGRESRHFNPCLRRNGGAQQGPWRGLRWAGCGNATNPAFQGQGCRGGGHAQAQLPAAEVQEGHPREGRRVGISQLHADGPLDLVRCAPVLV